MFKKIFIILLFIILSTTSSYANISIQYKNKVDLLMNKVYIKLEKKYNKDKQILILKKLIIRIEALVDKNKNSENKKYLLAYIKDNIINKVEKQECKKYKIHKDIVASIFWIWEKADESNAFISNTMSAWDWDWLKHSMQWIENKFYIALPYNDFTEKWIRRENAKLIPWYNEEIKDNESLVKNKWVKIEYKWKIAYAQWEDVWPLLENDFDYVFWEKEPKNDFKLKAWIDLSPDLAEYLRVIWSWKVDWSFIEKQCVPKWEWTEIITDSNINWK